MSRYSFVDEAFTFPAERVEEITEVIDKINLLTAEVFAGQVFTTAQPPANDGYCDYSWLREEHCAHCLGHHMDPELEEASRP